MAKQEKSAPDPVNRWLAVGSGLMGLAVMLGALGAHALRDLLGPLGNVYDKAAFYHFLHAIGILLIGILISTKSLCPRRGNIVCAMLTLGIALFSGSLYLLAITKVTILGAITPFGGILFIVGWFYLAWSLTKTR